MSRHQRLNDSTIGRQPRAKAQVSKIKLGRGPVPAAVDTAQIIPFDLTEQSVTLPPSPELTLRRVAEIYAGQDTRRWRFLHRLVERYGDTQVHHINTDFIAKVATALYPEASPETHIREVYTPLLAALKYAHSLGLCTPPHFQRPRLKHREPLEYLSPIQADAFLEACAGHLRRLFGFILATGARNSEAVYLRWEQVDLNHDNVHFLGNQNRDERSVALPPAIVTILQGLSTKAGEVFRKHDGQPYARKQGAGGQSKTGSRSASRRAGINPVTPAKLRSTWAVWHLAVHRNFDQLVQDGGWSDVRLIRRYKRISTEELDKLREALRNHPLAPALPQSGRSKGR